MNNLSKNCTRCKKEYSLTLENFYYAGKAKDGYSSWCIPCKKEYRNSRKEEKSEKCENCANYNKNMKNCEVLKEFVKDNCYAFMTEKQKEEVERAIVEYSLAHREAV